MVIIIKPTYACNFRCRYCYLNNNTKSEEQAFSTEFAKGLIRQIKDVLPKTKHKRLTLIWHGGEPLLWGVENYREVFAFMKEELQGVDYKNSLQTNLSLISDEYIELFKEYDVHVGFSLDGMRDINDAQRVDAKGRGTFDTIMEKFELCRKNSVSIGCIVVGSKKHIGRIPELYQFLCENKLNFKFNPLFASGEACNHIDEYGVTPDEYARMAIELFDLWYDDMKNNLVESSFVEIASNLIAGHPSGCLFGKNCQENFMAIAPTGDVFPCGRFCDTDKTYSYGNLHEESLEEIMKRIPSSLPYKRAEEIANSSCAKCPYYNICHGGCMHDGFLATGDFKGKSFLCPAYKKIFKHIKERIQIFNL